MMKTMILSQNVSYDRFIRELLRKAGYTASE